MQEGQRQIGVALGVGAGWGMCLQYSAWGQAALCGGWAGRVRRAGMSDLRMGKCVIKGTSCRTKFKSECPVW